MLPPAGSSWQRQPELGRWRQRDASQVRHRTSGLPAEWRRWEVWSTKTLRSKLDLQLFAETQFWFCSTGSFFLKVSWFCWKVNFHRLHEWILFCVFWKCLNSWMLQRWKNIVFKSLWFKSGHASRKNWRSDAPVSCCKCAFTFPLFGIYLESFGEEGV